MFKGLSYNRELKEIVEYENEIVSYICKIVTPDIKWEDSQVKGIAHEVVNEKVKHLATTASSHSFLRKAMKGKTFDGEDGLRTSIDPSSSEGINGPFFTPVLEPKHKIFLSHSGVQKEFVDHLGKALEDHSYFPFFDRRPESLPKGEEFPSLIFKATQQCQLLVVVISEEYFMSKWPMIELNAFVKSKKEMKSTIDQCILPLFYGLSVSEVEDEKRRLRWFKKWETFAKDDPKGLIKVDDWKHALDALTMFKGLSYNRELKEIVEYENEIVFYICKIVTPDISSLLREAVTKFARLSDTSLLTFPASDPDPVRIKDEDLQSLLPERHLSISVINFYIKYLEKEVISFKDKDRFFFFNCSFFISTFGTKITSTDIEFEQAQWIRGVNLLEKDYIFIPVHKRYSILWNCAGLSGSHVCGERILNGSEHWSLIIIYHLSSLAGSPTDVHYRSPCIFHLDSVRGKHDDSEGDIRSFIFESWTKIHQNSDILQAFFRMKYIEVKVPQEDNGYDSGIYLLHYVELFILESASPDFSFGTEQGKSHFPGWDTSKVVAKRKHIQNLILKLSGMTQLQGTLRLLSSDIFSWLRFKAASEGRIEDVQNCDLTMVNGKGAESEHGGHQTGGVTVLNEHHPFILLREETRLLQAEAIRLPQVEEVRNLLQAEEIGLQADSDTPILRKENENRRSRELNWSSAETSVLLDSMVRFDRFPQGNNATRWDFIAGEVNTVCGTTRDGKQCRSRFDTLSKAFKQVYNFCRDNAKEFSEITEQERRKMRLSTTLTREWYTLIAKNYTYRKSGKRPFDYSTSSAAEIQVEAPADWPWPLSPWIDTDSIPSSSAGEFQSKILHETPPASPNNRHDGTPVPKSSVSTDPRPLVQRKKIRRDKNEMKGVYRRAVKDIDGGLRRFRYEPRFKPPRDINSLREPVKYNSLSLGGYNTLQDAKDVYQIAAYYYFRSDGRLDLGDGAHFLIPDVVELQSLRGIEKAIWVQRKAKEVFTAFQMEKARRLKPGLGLFRKEDQLSPANPNPETQKGTVHDHMTFFCDSVADGYWAPDVYLS